MKVFAGGLTLALALVSCAGAERKAPWAPSLEDGRTTRDDLESLLGPPTAEYEGGRIVAYRLLMDDDALAPQVVRTQNRDETLLQCVRRSREYSLILVFGEEGRLRRHSLRKVAP